MPNQSGSTIVPSFEDTHPYGWQPEQVQGAIWLLLGLMLFAIVSYVLTAITQCIHHGVSARSLMGMKPKNNRSIRSAREERAERAETRRIIERQRN
jgi:hypothetical protein